MIERLLVWRGLDPDPEFRAEVCRARRGDGRLEATGTALGVHPEAYRLDYELKTGLDYITESLEVRVTGEHWKRSLSLKRSPEGEWTADGERLSLGDALDCDLGLCPLTNTMPILRHGLARGGGEGRDFTMAWVSVPDLAVHAAKQRYEPLGPGRVRFVDGESDFSAELELDADGFVVRYPELAERVA